MTNHGELSACRETCLLAGVTLEVYGGLLVRLVCCSRDLSGDCHPSAACYTAEMAESPRITIRLTPEHLAALTERAESSGKPLTTYAAEVLARHCKVDVGERKPGLAGASEEVRKAAALAGSTARWKGHRKKSSAKNA